ncbi:MAG: DUF421 domain-containing protein [Clostridia bacterium]|nr:DUF421 domain-containing protein [Clostridia bacterium]
MIISLLRAVIIYLLITIALRFMGKRQIGEMQPTELVVTILISEVASIPLEDTDTPLFAAFIPVILIVCLEVLISGISFHSVKFRRLFTGKPIIVINNGQIDQKALKSLRISISDLLDTLRLKGFFDVQKVKYAVVEMNGQISVMPCESEAPLTPAGAGISVQKKEIPYTVVTNGTLITGHFKEACTSEKEIQKQLKKENLSLKEVFLMTCDQQGNYFTVKKEQNI